LQLEEVLADIYGVSPLELANLDVEHDAEMFQETLSKLPRGDSPLAEELENVPYSAAIEMQEYFVEYMRGLIHTSRTLSILKSWQMTKNPVSVRQFEMYSKKWNSR
jgi:hypothetical protein